MFYRALVIGAMAYLLKFHRCAYLVVLSSLLLKWKDILKRMNVRNEKYSNNMRILCLCRLVLCGLYIAIIVIIAVDLATVSKNAYNLVSLSGIIVYILLLFVFSFNPAKVQNAHAICISELGLATTASSLSGVNRFYEH